ncbi:MAG: hypothetical protein HFJ79_09800 [Clostridiales bacterium]|jgi:hypothetical protein|nr:hypothetical protein [Clostridiales bacterium]
MDAFVEQIVARKKGGREYTLIGAAVAAALVLLVLAYLFLLPFLGVFFLLLVFGMAYGVWWLISEQNVEYEYSVTNGDIDIDQITARRKRKRIVSVSGAKIESFQPYDAGAFAGRNFDRRVEAGSVPVGEGLWCFTYRSKKNGHTLVVFQPEQRVIDQLRGGLPKLVQMDMDKKLRQKS